MPSMGGRSGSWPTASRRSTSPIMPRASIARARSAIAALRAARSRPSPIITRRQARVAPLQSPSASAPGAVARPVWISIARMTRTRSLGCRRPAISGASAASRAWSAGLPCAWAIASSSARSAGSAGGAGMRPCVVTLARIGHVEEMVRHRRALLRRGLAGADVETAVDLARIRADHLDRDQPAEAHRDRGLADRGRADQHQQRRPLHHVRPSSRLMSRKDRRLTMGRPCGQK